MIDFITVEQVGEWAKSQLPLHVRLHNGDDHKQAYELGFLRGTIANLANGLETTKNLRERIKKSQNQNEKTKTDQSLPGQ